MAGDEVIAVLALRFALGAVAASGPATSPPVLEAIDGEADGAGAHRMRMSGCAGRWSVEALQDEFRRQAIRLCRHGAHVGEFLVAAPAVAGDARQEDCRVVRISAEIACRRLQP